MFVLNSIGYASKSAECSMQTRLNMHTISYWLQSLLKSRLFFKVHFGTSYIEFLGLPHRKHESACHSWISIESISSYVISLFYSKLVFVSPIELQACCMLSTICRSQRSENTVNLILLNTLHLSHSASVMKHSKVMHGQRLKFDFNMRIAHLILLWGEMNNAWLLWLTVSWKLCTWSRIWITCSTSVHFLANIFYQISDLSHSNTFTDHIRSISGALIIIRNGEKVFQRVIVQHAWGEIMSLCEPMKLFGKWSCVFKCSLIL